MKGYLTIGMRLYHKYLNNVTVTHIGNDSIKADTGARGILDFIYNDFGKVLFFHKEHAVKTFRKQENYITFFEEEKKLKKTKKPKQKDYQKFSAKKHTSKNNSHKHSSDINNPQHLVSRRLNPIQNKYNGIKAILRKRNIRYLMHFTRIENLRSILNYGIVPISIQKKKRINSMHNDELRIDEHYDCTSCSVSFPNYMLFYYFRQVKFPGTKWVVVIIDSAVLLSNHAYYYQSNAARDCFKYDNINNFCENGAFEKLFCDSITTKDNNRIYRANLQIDDNMTTDPQAEILIKGVIDVKYIKNICFQYLQDLDEFRRKNFKCNQYKFNLQVSPQLFNARKDYAFWKSEC